LKAISELKAHSLNCLDTSHVAPEIERLTQTAFKEVRGFYGEAKEGNINSVVTVLKRDVKGKVTSALEERIKQMSLGDKK
jgi:hypothetical protein